MIHRIPRNMSPRCCSSEAGSNMMGLQNDDKFMQHLPNEVTKRVCAQPQAMYEELENQLVHGNMNYSTTLQRKRKEYPRFYHNLKCKLNEKTLMPFLEEKMERWCVFYSISLLYFYSSNILST